MLQRNYNEACYARAKAHMEQETPGKFESVVQQAEEEIRKHYSALSPEEQTALKKEMLYAKLCYDCGPDEFFLYRFQTLPFDEWGTYITSVRSLYSRMLLPSQEARKNLADKYFVYRHYQEFFHREIFCITDGRDFSAFLDFVERHPSFIAKERGGSCGYSVQKFDTRTEDVFSIYQTLLKNHLYLLEELIEQSAEMKQLNDSSVNTVRALVLAGNGKVKLFDPLLRIGRRDSVVDNFFCGGLLALADETTGRIRTKFYDKDLNAYTKHPDTGVDLENYQIPRWDEAVAFLEQVATHLPDCGLLGWDIALTEQGWVVIETNTRPHNSGQMAEGKGHLPRLEQLVREIGFTPCERPFLPPKEQP